MIEQVAGGASRVLVISGVNMDEGGILSVLRKVVEAAERVLGPEWRIVVLAHRRDLLQTTRAEVLEFPRIKASWFRRMKFELVDSRRLARELRADVWLAMHDITPLVDVARQYVYCHNPTCFSKPSLRALHYDKKFVAHSLFYGFLYALNIRRNTEVFVQQAWIREQFMRRFGARSVTVARPAAQVDAGVPRDVAPRASRALRRWVYPTFPRHFKNIEVIGEALEILERSGGWPGEVEVTVSAADGLYVQDLLQRFGHLKSMKFIGRQTGPQVQALYAQADGLLFPSMLETWGLPITEAQAHGLALLVADLEYGHETVGNYDAVTFFDPQDARALAELLRDLASGARSVGRAVAAPMTDVPMLFGWDALVREVCR